MRSLAVIVFTFLLFAAMAACSGVDENTIPNQTTAIKSYLNTLPNGYDSVEGSVFRYYYNSDRANRENGTRAQMGDSLEMWFDAFVFRSPFTIANRFPFYSNREVYRDSVPTLDWPFGEKGVRLGTTPMLKGLRDGLMGSYEKDSLMLLFPSDKAYGDNKVGALPENTPVAYIIKIDKIIKSR